MSETSTADGGDVDDPTQIPGDDAEQAAEMHRSWARIAVVSVAILLVLAFGLLQAAGLVEPLAPLVDSRTGQWFVFAALAVAVLAAAAYSWRASATES